MRPIDLYRSRSERVSCALGWLAESWELRAHIRVSGPLRRTRKRREGDARVEGVLQLGDGAQDLDGRVHVARVACGRTAAGQSGLSRRSLSLEGRTEVLQADRVLGLREGESERGVSVWRSCGRATRRTHRLGELDVGHVLHEDDGLGRRLRERAGGADDLRARGGVSWRRKRARGGRPRRTMTVWPCARVGWSAGVEEQGEGERTHRLEGELGEVGVVLRGGGGKEGEPSARAQGASAGGCSAP